MKKSQIAVAVYLHLIFITSLFVTAAENNKTNEKKWPDVLVIDDFNGGAEKWICEDNGKVSIEVEPDSGKKTLVWTASDDGVGAIVFKNLSRGTIDFSQYDLLSFRIKVSGKPIWNFGLILQQSPAIYGFRGLYYSIDTLHPFDNWFTFYQDLTRWENVTGEFIKTPPASGEPRNIWKNSFSPDKQEFRFEISPMAGSGITKIYLSDIRLIKNPIGVKPSYPGIWKKQSDGSQQTMFPITIKNKRNIPITVRIDRDSEDSRSSGKFLLSISDPVVKLSPGEERQINAFLLATPSVITAERVWYGESVKLSFHIDEIPEVSIISELTAGTKPDNVSHPIILCDEKQMHALHEQYSSESGRSQISSGLLRFVKDGEQALKYTPEYPPMAIDGITNDPVSGGALIKVNVPNLPFDVYQDSISGRTYSGPLYDAGMKQWKQKHLLNAENAKKLAIAYLVSGRKDFAEGAASILKKYIDVYLMLPISAFLPGCGAGSACSGSVRIDGTFMRERVWLTNMALALDSIIPAQVLSKEDIFQIGQQVFSPSAMNMMDHEIGAMNLQVMVDSASLYAGLAAEIPDVVSRALWGTHGIQRVFNTGYLPDGNWWENPSYQTVMNLCAYPVLAVGLRTGIFQWNTDWQKRITASYRMNAPDLFSPELGTGFGKNTALEDTFAKVLAPLVPDPQLAWICYNRKPSAATGEIYPMSLFSGATPLVAKEDSVSPIASNTVHFDNYGGVAMRVPDTDAYTYMHYGREVTHGHRNKLSIQAYGKGGWYMRNVMGGYTDNFKDYLETVASASTIMVDEQNARSDTGELLSLNVDKDYTAVSAKENGAWLNVEHERSVILTKGPLIIIDRCQSDTTHTYDWLYYATPKTKLGLSQATKVLQISEKIGDSPIFSTLQIDGRFQNSDEIRWERPDGSGLKMRFNPDNEIYLTRTNGMQKKDGSGFGDNKGVLWRQKGSNVFFIAILWPYAKGENGIAHAENVEWNEDLNQLHFAVKSPEIKAKIVVSYSVRGNERILVTKQ